VPRDAIDNPQLQHRGFFETEHHPLSGDHVMATGVPFRMTGVESWIRFASPTLGQHTDEVLRSVGYTDDELGALRAAGVIGEELR
jgi:crotonobetainyl-CoA:carnitine CoA-transferase CaiB-like acyl-CoA transferase